MKPLFWASKNETQIRLNGISDVWKMTPGGKFTYLLEPTEHPPRAWSIWRDRAGNMYFIDQNNHTKRETLLLRRTPDGTVITFKDRFDWWG